MKWGGAEGGRMRAKTRITQIKTIILRYMPSDSKNRDRRQSPCASWASHAAIIPLNIATQKARRSPGVQPVGPFAKLFICSKLQNTAAL